MLTKYNDKEKSLTRRFLLILGFITFVCVIGLGATIIFWDRFPLDLSKPKKIAFGAVLVLYSTYRFFRLLKQQPNEK